MEGDCTPEMILSDDRFVLNEKNSTEVTLNSIQGLLKLGLIEETDRRYLATFYRKVNTLSPKVDSVYLHINNGGTAFSVEDDKLLGPVIVINTTHFCSSIEQRIVTDSLSLSKLAALFQKASQLDYQGKIHCRATMNQQGNKDYDAEFEKKFDWQSANQELRLIVLRARLKETKRDRQHS